MHLSQLVKLSLTVPTVPNIPLGVDVAVGAAEVAVALGNLTPVGRAEVMPAKSVGTAVGTVTPLGTSVGTPAGTAVGTFSLGKKSFKCSLMTAAVPPGLSSGRRR